MKYNDIHLPSVFDSGIVTFANCDNTETMDLDIGARTLGSNLSTREVEPEDGSRGFELYVEDLDEDESANVWLDVQAAATLRDELTEFLGWEDGK